MKAQDVLKALKSKKGFEKFESYKEIEELKKIQYVFALEDIEQKLLESFDNETKI